MPKFKRAPTKLLPPVAYLRECLTYDPESGVLTWRARPREHFTSTQKWSSRNGRHAGAVAGIVGAGGYLIVKIDTIAYKAQRLIWKWQTGEEPPAIVDHKDTDKLNNRWDNLRVATTSQSTSNQNIRRDNTSGIRGVGFRSGRWVAHFRKDGIRVHLGTFSTREEAVAARAAAAREAFGEFYRE